MLPETTGRLSIDLYGMILNVHFFIEEEIELDLDLVPHEVNSEARFAALLEFMRGLARSVDKPVRLTPENSSVLVLVEVFPDSSVSSWHPDDDDQSWGVSRRMASPS